jgi:hypothetical protein
VARGSDERKLPRIARLIDGAECAVRRLAIPPRRDVFAAAENEAGHDVERPLRVRGVERRKDEGDEASRFERADVSGVRANAHDAVGGSGGRGQGDEGGNWHDGVEVVVASERTAPVCYTAEAHSAFMFENFRQALNALLSRGTPPEERRALLGHMRETLARAKAGVEDLRDGVEKTRARLAAERRELDTVRRRKRMAAEVNDAQTVSVAERFEIHHAERVLVLEQKLAAQEREVVLAEQEVLEMTRAFKSAAAGAGAEAGPSIDEAAAREVDEALGGPRAADFDDVARTRQREQRDADAERRLAELKRRMGK